MYQFKTDPEKNRLYVTLKGRITTKESLVAADEIVKNINTLKNGFDVVTDISAFEPATRKEAEVLVEVQKSLIERGVRRIVRVTGTSLKATVGKIQFERASRHSDVEAQNFDSLEEAIRYLDG